MNTSAVSPGRAGLLLLLGGQMLPLIDTSITNVALDAITHTLAASATQLESFENMTVSVLLVILYHATFYFARGALSCRLVHLLRQVSRIMNIMSS